jgi:Asp-tRNA(Asn)/Glu-tRNA(Gln) amidotransferase A subunit family amidase
VALHDLTLVEVLEGLEDGTFSAEELTRALIARAQHYTDLNAFISFDEDQILKDARAADARRAAGDGGPLTGAPIVLKDNIDIAGRVTTGGTNALRHNVAKRTAPVAQRLLDAGAVVFGKANLHELAFGCTSNNGCFGPARNPYDPDRIAGGSSGGTASAVGARLAPAGIGSDTGGSVRIPAGFCGNAGLRPTTDRYPSGGVVPISHSRDTAGPMARSVADVRLLDAVMVGRDSVQTPLPNLSDIRIGVPRTLFFETLDPSIATGAEAMLERFRSYGITLVEADIPDVEAVHKAGNFSVLLYEAVVDLNAYLAANETGLDFAAVVAEVGSPDVSQILEPLLGAGAIDEAAYREAMTVHRPRLQAIYADYFKEHRVDAVVYPTVPVLPMLIDQPQSGALEDGDTVPAINLFDRNTGPASNAGIPSLTIPAGVDAQGLPLSFTLDAPVGTDDTLLALGAALEAVEPETPAPQLAW